MRKKTISFGKHKGKLIGELPVDYLLWLYENVDLDRWGIRCDVEAALGIDDEDVDDEDDEPLRSVLEEHLEQVIREKQHIEQRLLEAQSEAQQLKDRFKLAYRRLSMAVHPDRAGSHEIMILVNELLKL